MKKKQPGFGKFEPDPPAPVQTSYAKVHISPESSSQSPKMIPPTSTKKTRMSVSPTSRSIAGPKQEKLASPTSRSAPLSPSQKTNKRTTPAFESSTDRDVVVAKNFGRSKPKRTYAEVHISTTLPRFAHTLTSSKSPSPQMEANHDNTRNQASKERSQKRDDCY